MSEEAVNDAKENAKLNGTREAHILGEIIIVREAHIASPLLTLVLCRMVCAKRTYWVLVRFKSS